MKRITWLILVMAILVVIPAWTQETGRVIRATEFVLEDNQGRERAILAMTSGEPGLFLYDENGEIRILLTLDNEGMPFLSFGDEQGMPRMSLYMDNEGPVLRFFDEKIVLRMELSLLEGSPALLLLDEKEQLRVLLELIEGTLDPALVLFDENGNRIAGVH